jgi:hypothetical protein
VGFRRPPDRFGGVALLGQPGARTLDDYEEFSDNMCQLDRNGICQPE